MPTKDFSDYNFIPSEQGFLGIGYIVQCKEGEEFGIVCYREDRTNKTWIYYFKKKVTLFYAAKTIVSFIKDSYEDKEPFEIMHICPLDNFKLLSIDERGQKISLRKRKDSYCHCDLEWDQIVHGMPYIIRDGNWISANYPQIDYINKSICYRRTYSLDFYNGRPESLLSCYAEHRELFLIKPSMSFEYVCGKLERIKEYILNFNIEDNLQLFIAGSEGYFQCRPGRDDSFFIIKYWYSYSKDPYLIQLTNLHEEKDYYNCQGRDEDDYCIINQEETNKIRNEVMEKYNKDTHYLFLINDFLTKLPSLIKEYQTLTHRLSLYMPNITDCICNNDLIYKIKYFNSNNQSSNV